MADKGKRIIGFDAHPDLFSAAALNGTDTAAAMQWVHDRQPLPNLEKWAKKHLREGDTVVLEASGNSFEIAGRLHAIGHIALVLESAQASKIRENFCNDDKHSAMKLARVYASGLAKEVWRPDTEVREHRTILFAYRNAAKDATRLSNRIRSWLNEYCVRLPKGTRLSLPSGQTCALAQREWSKMQRALIEQMFAQLWAAQAQKKQLEKIMVAELAQRPQWAQLWRLMGIRHRVAFALMAILGEVHRFPTAKKLVGYLGLSPRKKQSGNNSKGREQGMGHTGRGDVRAMLIQSAQNALNQKGSPLHKWGWRLTLSKSRNQAVAAVARKLTVSIWHLLMGHHTTLVEASEHLREKLAKLATVLGKHWLKENDYPNREAFVLAQIESIKNIPKTT